MATVVPTSGTATEPGFDCEPLGAATSTPAGNGAQAAAPVQRVTLRNGLGMQLAVLTRGGIIQSMIVPDREGLLADVTLGYDSLEEYAGDANYFGALIGRYANRIANGRFVLDGREHRLATNDRANHLHGGPGGFHAQDWRATPFVDGTDVGVHLEHESPDGHEGYPGNLAVRVSYTLTAEGELACDYFATTDRPTPVNLTQHAYWNLAGHDVGDVLDHELTLAASRYTPVDAALIPTGELRPVAGTGFDFREARTIGEHIDDMDEQLRIAHGYDHNFVLDAAADRRAEPVPEFAARLSEPASGRVLELFTSEPGVQLYTGNMIAKDLRGKGQSRYRRHSGVVLETQHFPDSPNRPAFPSTILQPGQEFRSRTIFKFSVRA